MPVDGKEEGRSRGGEKSGSCYSGVILPRNFHDFFGKE